MSTVTKASLAEELSAKFGFTKKESEDIIEHSKEEIIGSLERGEDVKLSGFGNFYLRDKDKRPGRNPKTGKEVEITERRVVTFRPGQKIKDKVGQYVGAELD